MLFGPNFTLKLLTTLLHLNVYIYQEKRRKGGEQRKEGGKRKRERGEGGKKSGLIRFIIIFMNVRQ